MLYSPKEKSPTKVGERNGDRQIYLEAIRVWWIILSKEKSSPSRAIGMTMQNHIG